MDSGLEDRLLLTVVGGFALDWWDVSDGGVQSCGVPPVHPPERGELDVFHGAPGPCSEMSALL